MAIAWKDSFAFFPSSARLRTLLLGLCICCLCQVGYSQRTMLPVGAGIQIGYVGDQLLNPGLKAGLDWPVLIWEVRKDIGRQGGFSRTSSHQLVVAASLGGYVAPSSHQALFLQTELGYRVLQQSTRMRRFISRIDLLGGVAGGVYGGEGNTGDIREGWIGSARLLPTLSVALGGDLQLSSLSPPLSWHIKPGVWLGQGNAFGVVEIGVIYRFYLLEALPRKVWFIRK